MSVIIDNLIAYRILSILVNPFTSTDAYRLGIIDENGKNLIKPSKFTKPEQKEAYTYLHRLVFNMKRILTKIPGGDNKIKNIVTALWLIREYYDKNDKQLSLMEEKYLNLIQKDIILAEELILVEAYMNSEYCDACDRPKKDCICDETPVKEEGGAPANSTGVAVSTDRTVVRSKDIENYKKKNKSALSFVRRMNKQL